MKPPLRTGDPVGTGGRVDERAPAAGHQVMDDSLRELFSDSIYYFRK